MSIISVLYDLTHPKSKKRTAGDYVPNGAIGQAPMAVSGPDPFVNYVLPASLKQAVDGDSVHPGHSGDSALPIRNQPFDRTRIYRSPRTYKLPNTGEQLVGTYVGLPFAESGAIYSDVINVEAKEFAGLQSTLQPNDRQITASHPISAEPILGKETRSTTSFETRQPNVLNISGYETMANRPIEAARVSRNPSTHMFVTRLFDQTDQRGFTGKRGVFGKAQVAIPKRTPNEATGKLPAAGMAGLGPATTIRRPTNVAGSWVDQPLDFSVTRRDFRKGR
jgi:hypothetical protein